MNFNEAALKLHDEHHGKIEVTSKVPVKTRDDLSTAYTPSRGFCRFGMRSIGKILLQCAGMESPCTVTAKAWM